MKITLESTNQIVYVNGVPARVWKGQSDKAINIIAFIAQIGVPEHEPNKDFQDELLNIDSELIGATPFKDTNAYHFITKY